MKVWNHFAAAVALAAAGALYAQDPAPATKFAASTTVDEIRALRARLDQLEAQQHEQAIKAEANKTTEQVIEDATRRSQLLDAGSFSAGYKENRFYIGSEDGNFVLRPWLHFQAREVALSRQHQKDGNADTENDIGPEIRRLKLGFDGNMFSPDLTYFFNWATSRAGSNSTVTGTSTTGGVNGTTSTTISNNLGGVPVLEEAWVKYHFAGTPIFIKGGQIKDPLLHEQIVSSRYQQSAERSLTADIFANGDAFTEGATLIYDNDGPVRAEAGYTHGMRSADTDFRDYPNNGSLNAFDWGAAGRVEYKLFGRWKDYAQIGAVGTKEDLLVFGVGVDYSERGHFRQTVGVFDAMYASPTGLNVYGSLVDRYTNHNFGIYSQTLNGASIGTAPAGGPHTNEYSGLIQVGYNIDQHIEPFGRFEYMKLQGTAAGSKNYVPVITGGANYYFVGHRAKITAEVQYLPHGIPVSDGSNDILSTTPGKGEIMGEVQFQLLL